MINLFDLLPHCSGVVAGSTYATTYDGFAYDSRNVLPGQLFVAVVSETGDGHRYIHEACHAGATGVLCQQAPEPLPEGTTIIIVPDTRQALKDYARYVYCASQRIVIGVAGTLGKTSTKEAIASVLSNCDNDRTVFRSPGNQSGRYGLAIASGQIESSHKTLVLELAVDAVGEAAELADMTAPSVLVLTNLDAAYLESFGSIEGASRELASLIAMLPADGTLIYNADDERLIALAAVAPCITLRYGHAPECDLRIGETKAGLDGTTVSLIDKQGEYRLYLPYVGRHHADTAAAAALVGHLFNKSWKQITQGLACLKPLPGRTRVLAGRNGATLLDDSFSATPGCQSAALDTLNDLHPTRRILVLGDMSHLGEDEYAYHTSVGRLCAGRVDLLFTLGDLAHHAGQAAVNAGLSTQNLYPTFTAEDLVRKLLPLLQPGDMVLLKGSARMRLEHVTERLLADPLADAPQLPRQSQGWAQVRLGTPDRPAWVEVDLEAIAENVRILTAPLPANVERLMVLKANGYGHGAVRVAQTALNNGGTWLGVACVGEAITLRQAGITAPILVLGYIPAWQARQAVLYDATAAIYSDSVAEAMSHAARDLGRTAKVHIKVDTGMGRLGLLPEDVLAFVERISSLPALQIEGIFSHFANADADDLSFTYEQLAQFHDVIKALEQHGLRPPLVHIANSAAILRVPESIYDMVRLGIAMYGLPPSNEVTLPAGVRPALSFKCQVAQVKPLAKGRPVGYGCTWMAQRPSRIAVIPVGYADGFRRGPHNWGEVLIRGQRAPIIGRVCMDQSMVDVTDIPGVTEGDQVVLIGRQGSDEITAQEVADKLGTIHYEVVSEILSRVPRIV